MKIKMTIIAFFASALILSSCMKNEVSPGLEQVRSAYAALLNAKASALTTAATAQAALTQAQASVQLSIAAVNAARAAGIEALTAIALANLEVALEQAAIATARQQLVLDELLNTYALLLKANKNVLADAQYASYVAALGKMRAIQDLIFAKQAAMTALMLDLENGTTLAYAGLVVNLATQNAALVVLQANLTAATAAMGNTVAVAAKIAELSLDSSTLENTKKTLIAEMKALEPGFKTELDAYNTAKGLSDAAQTALNTAKANVTSAAADFAALNTVPAPDYWTDAVEDLRLADSILDAKYADTLTSAGLLADAKKTIADGTTAIDAKITGATDSIALYTDTIAQLVADTLAKFTANVAADALVVSTKGDTATWHTAILVKADSLADQRARWLDNTPSTAATADSISVVNNMLDSTVLSAQIIIGEVAVTNAVAAAVLTASAVVVADNAYDTDKPTIASLITAIKARRTAYGVTRVATLADIVTATANLPDLTSAYLYHQTFLAGYVKAAADALAAKEALRSDYETYMEAYYDSWLAALVATQATKQTAYDTKKATTDAANAAFKLAKTAWTAKGKLLTAAGVDLALIDILLPAWKTVATGHGDFLAAFKAAISVKEAEVKQTTEEIAATEQAYKDGMIDYDRYVIDLASLQDQLTAAEAQVVFWKKILDETLAG